LSLHKNRMTPASPIIGLAQND